MKHKYYIVLSANYPYTGLSTRSLYATYDHKIGQNDIDRITEDFLNMPTAKVNGEMPTKAIVTFFQEIKR